MKQSTLFTKTRKEAPSDEVSKNAKLLIRAGYIHKEMAGVYSFLPLGKRVLENVTNVIREEMRKIGGQEISLTALQDKKIWKKTGRWSDEKCDVWFKTQLKNGRDLGLGWTHEEPVTNIMSQHIDSYRDLPKYVFQIQTKFRNELRAKSGILRGREFLMKDLYAFSKNKQEHKEFHEQAEQAYQNVYKRVGLGDSTYYTYAPGGSFAKYSHEFQTLSKAGEDTIHLCGNCEVAINEEIIDEFESCPECSNKDLSSKTAIEVGDIYTLKTQYSEPLGLTYNSENGEEKPVFMGCYGIGCGRTMGAAVEVHSDENGITWPQSISPFDVHLVNITHETVEMEKSDQVYEKLINAGVDVLYDDRENSQAGEKFADSDLIGIPTRIVISSSNLKEDKAEIMDRKSESVEYVDLDQLSSHLNKNYVQ